MAINRTPDPVLCADIRRHDPNPPPPATTLVRKRGYVAFTGRCDPCARSLAAASADALIVDVYDLGPARTTARYDADTATPAN